MNVVRVVTEWLTPTPADRRNASTSKARNDRNAGMPERSAVQAAVAALRRWANQERNSDT